MAPSLGGRARRTGTARGPGSQEARDGGHANGFNDPTTTVKLRNPPWTPVAVQSSLKLRHHGCITEQFPPGMTLAQIAGERGSDLYILHVTDPDDLDGALRLCEDHRMDECGLIYADVIARDRTSVVFRGENPDTGVVATIRSTRCTILWPAVYRDGLEFFEVLAPSRDELARLLDRLDGIADVAVEQLVDVSAGGLDASVPLADLTAGLTDRQLEVLEAAIGAGYYRTPREATTAELAGDLGVSPSTLKEHLQKAERHVVETFAGLLDRYRGLG